MSTNALPLQEVSIRELFGGSEQTTYEVPIYQRNYAWGIDEITALVQDVYDAYRAKKDTYFIGTLVTFHRGKRVFEVIDGQQRLTTIYLTLKALGESPTNNLTYRSRKKSTDTIDALGKLSYGGLTSVDVDIVNGFDYANEALELVPQTQRSGFREYFLDCVHIIFYQVPKDVDLNHYFEVMNSRGEQLEQHEVVKAALLGKLHNKADREKLNQIWERCGEMDCYIQQRYQGDKDPGAIFGSKRNRFLPTSFDNLPEVQAGSESDEKSIIDLISEGKDEGRYGGKEKAGARFQPIIDFSNFLLIVLKLTRMGERDFDPSEFILDDKELIRQFDTAISKRSESGQAEAFAKEFGYNLLLSKFYLDNYIVHHVNEDDKPGDNPWKLQRWERHESERGDKGYPTNLFDDSGQQSKSEQLLSMFEVSFTARQRKNYLMYCMLYLHGHKENPGSGYPEFLSNLAKAYLHDVYLGPDVGLNENNTPTPGSFDAAILTVKDQSLRGKSELRDFAMRVPVAGADQRARAKARFGNGEEASRGIPLFVFNYLDYLIWETYYDHARGSKKADMCRVDFFRQLGCSDFGLDLLDDFYFSRTRRSLEHYYSQAQQKRDEDSGKGGITRAQINCLGNYAMIGKDVNSSGSDWSPKVKLDHYLDEASGKINRVAVASLKFMVMMQICKDNEQAGKDGKEWVYEDIGRHQESMVDLLLGGKE